LLNRVIQNAATGNMKSATVHWGALWKGQRIWDALCRGPFCRSRTSDRGFGCRSIVRVLESDIFAEPAFALTVYSLPADRFTRLAKKGQWPSDHARMTVIIEF